MKKKQTNSINDLNSSLSKNNQNHCKCSLSYNGHYLSIMYSVSSHGTLCTYPFLLKKEYAKSNKPIFKFAYSTTYSAGEKRDNIERSEICYDFNSRW